MARTRQNKQLAPQEFKRPRYPQPKISLPAQPKADLTQPAILLQSLIRGKLTRKQFQFPAIKETASTNQTAFLLGNDPDIDIPLNYLQNLSGTIGLFSISGFRSIAIACQLSVHNPVKTILADNSTMVINLWKEMTAYAEAFDNEEDFFENLPTLINRSLSFFSTRYNRLNELLEADFGDHSNPDDEMNIEGTFLEMIKSSIRSAHSDEQTDILHEYFASLADQYGFDKLRNTILNTSVILQNWHNPSLFITAKNIFDQQGINHITVYASNVVAVHGELNDRLRIMNNIELLKPAMTIYTNYDMESRHPTQAHYIPANSKQAFSLFGRKRTLSSINNIDIVKNENDENPTKKFRKE